MCQTDDVTRYLGGFPLLYIPSSGKAVTQGSWARISVLDGLPRGMIWDGRELFIVDAGLDQINAVIDSYSCVVALPPPGRRQPHLRPRLPVTMAAAELAADRSIHARCCSCSRSAPRARVIAPGLQPNRVELCNR
jgi:hypothetical protein